MSTRPGTTRRPSSRRFAGATLASLLFIGIATGAGCSAVTRPARESAYLLERRTRSKATYLDETRTRMAAVLARVRREQIEYAQGRRPAPPVLDYLVISGGGDFGAFGAGVLKGWSRVPASDPLARPRAFDVVTGVSTGALIAPFAFVGDDDAIERINHLYRNPGPDWVKQRWPLFFLPNNISFAEVPGLEREVRAQVTPDLVARIAAAPDEYGGGGDNGGRMLAVGTTNLDDASPRVFYLVPEARRAMAAVAAAAAAGKGAGGSANGNGNGNGNGNASDDDDQRRPDGEDTAPAATPPAQPFARFHDILLASSGVPGAFPYREIDGAMYVDGCITGNVLYGGRLAETDTAPALWQAAYPGVPIPKIRYWVIFNNQVHAPPLVVRARWPDILGRSIELVTRSATMTAIRHLHAMAEISRLKRGADVEVRLIAIPDDWTPPVEGIFMKETMNDLADLGERMGADPKYWDDDVPAP